MLISSGVLLQRFHIGKVLGGNIFLWGIITACTAAVQNRVQLIALRTLLGACEAVITPALIMLTSAWYQRDEAAPRFGFWYCGLGAGQIIGGWLRIHPGRDSSLTHVQVSSATEHNNMQRTLLFKAGASCFSVSGLSTSLSPR